MSGLDGFVRGERAICVVGLGYVGLPLAVLLATRFRVIGYDINRRRVEELRRGEDRTLEVAPEQLSAAAGLSFSSDEADLDRADLFVVTVPTPVDANNRPDLGPVLSASAAVGRHLRRGGTVVYESTVYPGTTEEECVPVLERESRLVWKRDFAVGYSPERVNPGDREHTIEKIRKVVSGDSPQTLELLLGIYGAVITAGVHGAPDIKTAEAAKVIENTQRDLNIALMNELSLIFSRMGIDTRSVLAAAGTKWNFLRFEPGLVGGHCIGVDPYYLTFKAESLGYHPQVILAGRRINDSMGKHVAESAVKLLIRSGRAVRGSRVLVLGLTFKEDIGDIRNTKVVDIVRELAEYGVLAQVFDPHADPAEVRHEYGFDTVSDIRAGGPYDAVVLAVRHRRIMEELDPGSLRGLCNGGTPIVIDVKGALDREELERAGFLYWRL